MAKWTIYVLVFIYMCYRAVYGARMADSSISVEEIDYEEYNYLQVGTRKTVTCRAPLKNQQLTWLDPSGNPIERIPSNRVYAQEHFVSSPKGNRTPGLVLTFSELEVGDTGLYQCKSGNQKKSVGVCVIMPSEFVESDTTPTEVTIEAGRSITLACQANGDPEPIISWSRDGEPLSEGTEHPKYKVNRRYKIQGYESLLTITSVEPEDEGLYQCNAMQESAMLDNCNSLETRNITLQVKHKPIFSSNAQVKYGKNNEVVNMKCSAKGWPLPTYRWFKDLGSDVLYEFNRSKIIFSEEENSATLAVTASPTTYGNIYKCKASNDLGDGEKYFRVTRREKPWKADRISTNKITSKSFNLNVTWEERIHFPVDRISIQYISSSDLSSSTPEKSDWASAKELSKEIDPEEDQSTELLPSFLVELDKLEPETEYFVRVRAENDAGDGPWSDYEQFSTTSVPESVTEDNATTDDEESDDPIVAADVGSDSGMFYGIFFAGGILIVAFVCMFAMRLV